MSNKVLVIDNDEDTIAQVSEALGGLGYDVMSAATADSGRKMASELSPCLILINLATPGSNGLELCKTIHTTSGLEGVPIILLTLKEGKFNPVYVKLYGIIAFLKKPFDSSELSGLATQHAPVEADAAQTLDEPEMDGGADFSAGEAEEEDAYSLSGSDESLSDLQASFEQPIDYPEEGDDEQPSLIVKDDDPTSFDSETLDGLQDENELSGGFSTDEAESQWGSGGAGDSVSAGSQVDSAPSEDEGGWDAGHNEGGIDMQQDQDEWGSTGSEEVAPKSSDDAFGGAGSDDSFSAGASDEDAFSAGSDDSFSAGALDDDTLSDDEEAFSAGADDSFDSSGGAAEDFSAAKGGGDDFLGDDLAYEEEPKVTTPPRGKKAADEELPSLDDDFGLDGGDLSDLIQDDKGTKDKKMENKKGFKKSGGLSKSFIVAIVIILLLGGGAAAYFFLFDTAPKKKATPPPPPPRAAVEEPAPVPPIDEPAPGAPAPAPMDQAAQPAAPAPPAPAASAPAAPAPAPTAPAMQAEAAKGEAQKGKYYVQFGAFSKKANAEKMLKRLSDAGVNAFIISKKSKGKTLSFVLSASAMEKKADAEKESRLIRKDKGFDTAVYKH